MPQEGRKRKTVKAPCKLHGSALPVVLHRPEAQADENHDRDKERHGDDAGGKNELKHEHAGQVGQFHHFMEMQKKTLRT